MCVLLDKSVANFAHCIFVKSKYFLQNTKTYAVLLHTVDLWGHWSQSIARCLWSAFPCLVINA